jgi:hypothetical protein
LSLRDKVEAQIQAVTKYGRRPFAGDSSERAYLMGLRYGDLHVVRHGRGIRSRLSTTHPEMANLFESLFAPYGHVKRYPRRSRLTGFEWSLECDLDSSFGFLLEKIAMPELKRMPNEEFWAFLSGFIDAEGSIYLHRKSSSSDFEISISNTDGELVDMLQNRLRNLGYHPYKVKAEQDEMRLGYPLKGTISQLRIERHEEVCRMLQDLHLKHPEKTAKSAFVLHRICNSQFGVGADEELDWADLTTRIKTTIREFIEAAKNRIE